MHSNNRSSQYLSSAESSTYFDAKICHGVSEISDAVRLIVKPRKFFIIYLK